MMLECKIQTVRETLPDKRLSMTSQATTRTLAAAASPLLLLLDDAADPDSVAVDEDVRDEVEDADTRLSASASRANAAKLVGDVIVSTASASSNPGCRLLVEEEEGNTSW